MRQELIRRLSGALQTLPGEQAQYRMAPLHRRTAPGEPDLKQYRPSAVMILFCETLDNELFIPLIQRSPYQGAHSAQISLPGGKYEEQDGDLKHTAERECFEEIGISSIMTLGKLSPLHIPVSNFIVHPYIGICTETGPLFKPNEREVQSIIRLHPHSLMDDMLIEEGNIKINETMSIKAPWFNIEGHQVWGATAMILSELKELWRTIS